MNWFLFALIGAAAGWLAGWATDKSGSGLVKMVTIGSAGGLVGGGSIAVLMNILDTLAPMGGAVLGSVALLTYVARRGAGRIVKK